MRAFAAIPEAKVSIAIAHTDAFNPNASAVAPATSAPSA